MSVLLKSHLEHIKLLLIDNLELDMTVEDDQTRLNEMIETFEEGLTINNLLPLLQNDEYVEVHQPGEIDAVLQERLQEIIGSTTVISGKLQQTGGDVSINHYPKMWSWVHPRNMLEVASFTGSVPPVKSKHWKVHDQELTYSCVGFSLADGLCNFYVNLLHRLKTIALPVPGWSAFHMTPTRLSLNTVKFSSRFVWMMGKECQLNGQPCSTSDDTRGTDLYIALRAIFEFGQLALERQLPLTSTSYFRKKKKGFLYQFSSIDTYSVGLSTLAIGNFLASGLKKYYVLYWPDRNKGVEYVTEDDFKVAFERTKQWLSVMGPVAIELEVGQEFMNIPSAKKVLKENPNDELSLIDDQFIIRDLLFFNEDTGDNIKRFTHAVTAVGYYQDSRDEYLIIKNSWGKNFGYFGYVLLSKSYLGKEYTYELSPYPKTTTTETIQRKITKKIASLS